MDPNRISCEESIKKIEKKLNEYGYKIITTNHNILCKTPRTGKSVSKKLVYPSDNTTAVTAVTRVCPCNSGGSINEYNHSCTYAGSCTVTKNDCPLYNGSLNSETNISSYNKSDCLFRIKPSDTYNGIQLHAVILHGETCELKMLFNYNTDGIKELVDVINFLVG